GCIPAFDRFFIDGYNINSVGSKIKTVNSESINGIISFVEENQDEIELVKSRIYSNGQVYYPTMKIVDMYFWQLGLITDRNSKK
ncbi:MAG: hypothetical protein Q8859_11240, partial [Bacteroidota bacterium]|nr:hypothetical protein [Bacteroidota bacterium]